MNKRVSYFLSCFLCNLISLVVNAQDIDTLPFVIIKDSIYQTNVTSAENYEFKEPAGANPIDIRDIPDTKVKQLKSDKEYWYVDQVPSGDRESCPPAVNEKGLKERQERIRKSRTL